MRGENSSMPLKTKSAPKEHLGLTTRQKMKKYRAFYIMFIPLFLCLILFSYLPSRLLYAFTDYTPFKPAQFVGLQNFQKLFSQAGFWKAFFNTLQISITKLVIDTLAALCWRCCWMSCISNGSKRSPRPSSTSRTLCPGLLWLPSLPCSSRRKTAEQRRYHRFGGDSIYFLANEKWWRPSFI